MPTFHNGQPWGQLSFCIHQCTQKLQNLFKGAGDRQEAVRFANKKDFNNSFEKVFKFLYLFIESSFLCPRF